MNRKRAKRGSCALFFFFSLSACVNAQEIALTWDGSAAILIFERHDETALEGPRDGFAIPEEERRDGLYSLALPLEDLSKIYAIFYDATLDELQVEEGAQQFVERSGRRLLLPGARLFDSLVDPEVPTLLTAATSSDAIARLGLPPLDFASCVTHKQEGCLYPDAQICRLPCPDPVIEPPVPPELPSFLPCPAGWQTASLSNGVAWCEPYDPTIDRTCPEARALFLGNASCTRIGPDCVGEWAADLPSDAVFVSAGALPGGDGSQSAPFLTIAEAIQAGSATIALSRGHFAAQPLSQHLTLWGACVGETVIGAVEITAGEVTLRNLTIDGIRQTGGAVRTENVRIAPEGWWSAGATEIHKTVISGAIEIHGPLSMREVIVEGTVQTFHEAVTLRDVVIRSPPSAPWALHVTDGSFEGERVVLEPEGTHGFGATNTSITVDRLLVRSPSTTAVECVVTDSSTVTITNAIFEGLIETAVTGNGDLDVEGIIVLDRRPQRTEPDRYFAIQQEGSSVVRSGYFSSGGVIVEHGIVSDLLIEAPTMNTYPLLVMSGEATRVELGCADAFCGFGSGVALVGDLSVTDLTVIGRAPGLSWFINAERTCSIRRGLFRNNHGAGIRMRNVTAGSFEDLEISGTVNSSECNQRTCYGAAFFGEEVNLTFERFALDHNVAGIIVRGSVWPASETRLFLSDGRISDNETALLIPDALKQWLTKRVKYPNNTTLFGSY